METVICPKCHKNVGISIDTPHINHLMDSAANAKKINGDDGFPARISVDAVCPLCESDFVMVIPVSLKTNRLDLFNSIWII